MKAIFALGAALALTACAGTGGGPPSGGLEGQMEPQSEGAVISEMSSPRDRARIHTELAAAYYELGNIGVALEEVRIALGADDNYAPAYNVLGLVNMDLKENDQAELNFGRALRIAPNDPDVNHNYGWFLCQSGREEQGVKHFLAAIRNPLYASPYKSYTLAGLCSLRRNNERDGIDYLERALRLEPNYLLAIMNLAQLRFRRGELDLARVLVAQFNRLVEPTAESLWLALRIERRLGDKTSEMGYAEQLRRRYAGSREFQSLQKGQYE